MSKRLITWNSKEDCIVWHKARGTNQDQLDEWVRRSMMFGNRLAESVALDLQKSYDINVY